jgi:Na+/H+ antiporter NhaD/arsenite permease-like protein
MNPDPVVLGVPLVFVAFALTLVGVALFNRRSLEVASAGFAAVFVLRVFFGRFDWLALLGDEWAKTLNLVGLLVGFALVADHFERSRVPEHLPRLLPAGAPGCFVLLALVWALSGVLDNIAAALIGAAAAARVFRRLHPGYVAAIVAAANAGGAGSVIGDTTTTMMWIDGVSPAAVAPAYLAAAVALLVSGGLASRQQARYAHPAAARGRGPAVDRTRVALVAAAVLVLALANVIATFLLGARAQEVPLLAAAVWIVLLVGARVRPLNRGVVRRALRAGLFLVMLVLSASMLPVDALPDPTLWTTFGLGFVSAVFDNIPLTKVALVQGGYDWSFLAYSVGFGGSMIWFGSSAGVAVSEEQPGVRSVVTWLRHAWHIPLAFLAGHAALFAVRGWRP